MGIASNKVSRRSMLVGTAAGGLLTATTLAQAQTGRLTAAAAPIPVRKILAGSIRTRT